MPDKKLSGRGLTSLLCASGLAVMGVSGLVAYLMPHGRIAYWTDWRFLSLSKTQWDNIHIISSLLFLAAAGIHLYFNWKPFLNYLKGKAAQMRGRKKELWISLAALLLVVAAGVKPFPPLSWLLDFNAYLKAVWVQDPAYEPPFGHAEELKLSVFAKKVGIPLPQALAVLEAKGVQDARPEATVLDIARRNQLSPMELFALIQPLQKVVQVKAPAGRGYSAQEVEELFAGSGVGNKTLEGVAQAAGQAPQAIKARLEAAGIVMGHQDTLKGAADKNGLATPLELLKVMLVEGYKPKR
ncbi:hypothetical protein AAU61_02405 [Desulfocarbo indianensis]|nr:hypothetical protein AAU61_02405 [Desulfocarbo indianensis]